MEYKRRFSLSLQIRIGSFHAQRILSSISRCWNLKEPRPWTMSRLSLLGGAVDLDDRVIGGSYLNGESLGVSLYPAPLRNRQRLLKDSMLPTKIATI